MPNVDIHMSAFRAMGEHLAGLPGRKTLIWISRGFPLFVKTSMGTPKTPPDFVDVTPKVREVSQVLSKYNVAVYPMDTRSLNVGTNSIDSVTTAPTSGKQTAAEMGSMYGSTGTGLTAMSQNSSNKDLQDAHDSGRLLAQLTGGRTYYDQNNFDYGIRSAMDDSKLVYTLGYYPPEDKWDSQFHAFKVQVKQSGLKLTYRSGYMAVPDQSIADATDAHEALDKAALAPLDSTAITLYARFKHDGAAAGSLTINLLVDVKDLTLEHEGNRWIGDLTVVIAQLTSAGDIPGNGARQHSVKLDLPDADYARMQAKGLELFFPYAQDPQAVQVRVVVRDDSSGAIGTVSIPLNKD